MQQDDTSLDSLPTAATLLVGQMISEVCFVEDYVMLTAEAGMNIMCTGRIGLTSSGQSFEFPKHGSRDALCALIGQRIAAVDPDFPFERMQIRFDEGDVLSVESIDGRREAVFMFSPR